MYLRGNLKVIISLAILMVFVFSLAMPVMPAGGALEEEEENEFAGGAGTEADPYLVETAEHLDNVREYLDAHFEQIADINLEDYLEGDSWEPVGSRIYPFEGAYDGAGYKISNLYIESPDLNYAGLFGYLGDSSELSNMGLESVNILGKSYVGGISGYSDGANIINSFTTGEVTGESENVGGLIGYSEGGSISDSYVKADVTGKNENVGGLIGYSEGENIIDSFTEGDVTGYGDNIGGLIGYTFNNTIENSYALGDIARKDAGRHQGNAGGLLGRSRFGSIKDSFASGKVTCDGFYTGGLIGRSYSKSITDCYATGDVKSDDNFAGGLIGESRGGTVTESYAIGKVTSSGDYIGGLVGRSSDSITKSCAKGAVIGNNSVGGLIGHVDENSIVENCYAKGDVSGDSKIGGLVGHNEELVVYNYAIGEVTGAGSSIGGLVGNNDDTVYDSYYDQEKTGQSDTGKGDPKTTEEMQTGTPSSEIYINWDEDIWEFSPDYHYPNFKRFLPGILDFNFKDVEELEPANINFAQNNVYVEVPSGTELTELVAEFELSEGAVAEVDGEPQESGETANDFTDPLIYEIHDEFEEITREWMVTVKLPTRNVNVYADPEEGGEVEGTGTYEYGEEVTVTATANEGYYFVNWTEDGDEVSTDEEYTFEVENDRELVANFESREYEVELTASPEEGGNVEGAGTYEEGEEVTVTAVSNLGYLFVNWTEDGDEISTDEAYTFRIEDNRNLTANFEEDPDPDPRYEVELSASPEEGGNVEGAGTYEEGDEITITATPNEGFLFVNWTEDGDEVTTDKAYTFQIEENRSLTANFEEDPDYEPEPEPDPEYEVDLSASPEEGGDVEGVGTYDEGEEVTVTATSNEGYYFVNWTENGREVSANKEYVFEILEDRVLVANFEQREHKKLSDLEIGDKVVDNSWEWEYRTGTYYTYNTGDVTRPVTWIVVAKDHYGEGGVTLVSEELIGMHVFDDSSHVHRDGHNHWGESGTHHTANYGIRPWLNSTGIHDGEGFYDAFSNTFQSAVIPINLPNKDYEGSSYSTQDRVFVPSTTELGDIYHRHTHSVGSVYPYFDGVSDDYRISELPRLGTRRYWSRSPFSDGPSYVSCVDSGGGFVFNMADRGNAGVRPALNIRSEIPVSVFPNEDGVYEIELDFEIGIEANRIFGEGRYDTAVEISRETFDERANTVVLARGDDFPDALAGVPLAHEKGGPLLLTRSDNLPGETASEIGRLLTEGDTVYVLGGEAAVSRNVKDDLVEKGYEVKRLKGDTRFETAIAIAEELTTSPEETFLTTGLEFADAVAVSGPAAMKGAPILITRPTELSESTANYLTENEDSIKRINVIGGEAAVSQNVKEEAGATRRVYGANRWETAVEIANRYVSAPEEATLATGLEFPDALSGGVYAAANKAPVLLTARNELIDEVESYFDTSSFLVKVTVFGGTEVITDSVLARIEDIK